jgi:glycosyltransferase involved in cell wall biosynthesis
MLKRTKVAIVYGAPIRTGGLGMQAWTALNALSKAGVAEVHAFGPEALEHFPCPNVTWHHPASPLSSWWSSYTWLRWMTGRHTYLVTRRIGQWARDEIKKLHPDLCYVFTEVGLETLLWAKRMSVPSVLDNPNGHIRNFRKIYVQESKRWASNLFLGHPTSRMVRRVEREYELAERIRVSSQWSKRSMIEGGVPARKIVAIGQPVDLDRFTPTVKESLPSEGPLRICFVGSLDLRKGFIYLLRAIRAVGSEHVELRIVGATGDRWSRMLFQKESRYLNLSCITGDPISTYGWSEILILPTLEDGFGFVVPEAMASGLPVIVTDACGAAELVNRNWNGWIVSSASVNELIDAISRALRLRSELSEMGRRARRDIEKKAGQEWLDVLCHWFYAAPRE